MSDYQATYIKDPDAVDYYPITWVRWLDSGESVLVSDWFIVNDDFTLAIDLAISTATLTTVYLSGGTLGSEYLVTNRITTDSTPPRVADQTIRIRVRNK